jgi:hypothetical protein
MKESDITNNQWHFCYRLHVCTVFKQTPGIPMGTNCASLLADMFLHTYEAEFPRGFLKNKDRNLAQTCNSNFRYIEDILSLTNSQFCHYLHLICPNNLVAKNILFTCTSNMIYQLVFVSVCCHKEVYCSKPMSDSTFHNNKCYRQCKSMQNIYKTGTRK